MKYSSKNIALVSAIFLQSITASTGMAQPSANVKSRTLLPKDETTDHKGHEHEKDHNHAEEKNADQHQGHDHSKDKKDVEQDHDHSKDKKDVEQDHDHSKDKKDAEHGHDHVKDKKDVEQDHDHSKDKKDVEHDHDHGKEEKGDQHGHGEARSNVGPNKGVTEASEDKGFLLKEKVERNFSIQRLKLSSNSPLVVPTNSLLFSGAEKQVFRYRDGYWKAVDVEIVKRGTDTSTIASKDLAAGDSIAITGVGFLKIINQSVFGPAIEGHVH